MTQEGITRWDAGRGSEEEGYLQREIKRRRIPLRRQQGEIPLTMFSLKGRKIKNKIKTQFLTDSIDD